MTAISFGQAARGSRSGRTAITSANKDRRSSEEYGRYRIVSAELRGQFDQIGNTPQAFAGGFVDFLLGRGARHSR
jgi:hypothetical protein